MTFWITADKPLTDGARVLTARSLGREGGWQLRHGYHDGQRWMQADTANEWQKLIQAGWLSLTIASEPSGPRRHEEEEYTTLI